MVYRKNKQRLNKVWKVVKTMKKLKNFFDMTT